MFRVMFLYNIMINKCITKTKSLNTVDPGNHIIPELNSSISVTEGVNNTTIVSREKLRSRHARFLYDKSFESFVYSATIKHEAMRHVRPLDRKPSRIPGKTITRLLGESRKLRKLVRKHIRKNVPRFSRIFRLLDASSRECKILLNDQVRYSTPISCGRRATMVLFINKARLQRLKITRKNILQNSRSHELSNQQ